MSNNNDTIAWLTSARDDAAIRLLEDVLQQNLRPALVVCAVGRNTRSRDSQIAQICAAHDLPYERFFSEPFDCTSIESALGNIVDDKFCALTLVEFRRRSYDRSLGLIFDRYGCRKILLAGYMRIATPVLSEGGRVLINLHPAPPHGPTGSWQDVIWSLIAVRANVAGGMLHIVTEKVDRGPVVSYYTTPIDGDELAPLWSEFLAGGGYDSEQDFRGKPEAIRLFDAIRNKQFIREAPLIILTLQGLLSGALKISSAGLTVDRDFMPRGLSLDEQIERMLGNHSSNPNGRPKG